MWIKYLTVDEDEGGNTLASTSGWIQHSLPFGLVGGTHSFKSNRE